MKAIVQRRFGGPEVLALESVPDPNCGPDQVVVDVHAVSVNTGLDFGAREGTYARPVRLPHVLGVDPSGTIIAVGSEVADWKVGDRVWVDFFLSCGACPACKAGRPRACATTGMLGITQWGGYAEQVVVPARNLHKIPDALSFAEATVVARHFPLAMFLVNDRAKIQSGESILVMGATGGLGNACSQIARMAGANVIACVSTNERVEAAKKAGAHHTINYREQDILESVLQITDGRGVDVVCENVGDPQLWEPVFQSLAPNGRLVTAGAHAGGHVQLDIHRLYLRRLSLLGGANVPVGGVERALNLASAGELHAGIAQIIPLSDAEDAHRRIAARSVVGKIVLDPKAIN